MPKVLAICGSTRAASSNLNVIHAFAQLARDRFTVELYTGLEQLPQFNPDRDNDQAPEEVADLRRRLRAADGILICTPEYAIGVPGALKNAIDWTVSSMEFSKKPVALITASLSGEKAHQSLLGTLLIIESRMTQDSHLLISAVRTKVGNDGAITDEDTLQGVNRLIGSLEEMMADPEDSKLSSPRLGNSGVDS
ncbi:MAG: NAD(P)H-dependent oxidoreductase [Bacteroidetes bacterium]|nr:NAD(P)H-dependent oxidoreductase [Bacteroidota bacterium]MBS1941395.1 NAD(P)H-dependent oxidoreductase [Bacteroidota bacterium]